MRYLLAALLLPVFALAQQTRYVVKQNPLEYNIEKYYGLKADTTIKHGSYKMINFFGGEPILIGYYKNNHKDSLWQEFATMGEVFVQATGNYKNDRKVGVWTYSDKHRSIEQKYDHTNNKLVYFRPDANTWPIVQGKDTVNVKPERPPLFVGGSMAMKSFIMGHLSYPESAMKKGIQGKVTVAILVSASGHITRVWIKKGVEQTLNNAALGVFRQLPDTWVPAMYKGKPVASVFTHEIPFLLQ